MRVLSGSRARAPEAEEVELPLPELSRVEDLVIHAHGRELPHTGREGEIVDLVSDAVAGEGLGDVRGDDRVYPRTLQLGDAPEDPPEIEVREAEEGLERDCPGPTPDPPPRRRASPGPAVRRARNPASAAQRARRSGRTSFRTRAADVWRCRPSFWAREFLAVRRPRGRDMSRRYIGNWGWPPAARPFRAG